MKHFGAKSGDAPPRREPFTFGVLRGDEIETHHFIALLGKIDAGGLITALRAAEQEDGGKALSAYFRTIARVLDNRDGIPAEWAPEVRDKPEGDERPDVFRVPYGDRRGELVPVSEAPEYLKSEVHSSRRRWIHLLEKDDDAIVSLEDLTAIFEWVIAEASGKASAASS
jgi:hypothetical protein